MPFSLARPHGATPSCVFALLSVLATPPAFAQTLAAAAFPPVIVTATRSPQRAEDALADITVIDQDEIERAGPGGLAALLQRQPGVEITRNGGPAGVSSVFLRGTNRGQTIVLIDGVRVGSASTGAATLEAIPLTDIERIEILRGPASGLYGADAIGGVIQVFTRRGGDALSGGAQAGYGTYETREASGSIAGAAGPVRFAVSGSHRTSRGFNAVTNPDDFNFNPDRDGYAADSGGANAQWTWAPGQVLGGGYLRSRVDAQYDGGPGHDDRTITVIETTRLTSDNRLGPRWLSRITIGESTDDSVSRTGFGDFPFRTRERQYAWLTDMQALAGALTLGAERREERVATDAGFTVTGRDTNAVLALYQWRGGAHAAQANVRYDDSSQFGGRTTGGVRYAYRLSPALELSAAASTAFKAPSFNDLYYPDFSNPALRPETARNFEAGATWRASTMLAGNAFAWEARAVAYRNRVRDLIVFECDAQFVCAPQNVADATLSGATFVLDARHGGTSMVASLDVQDPRDDRTDLLLPRRARQHGAIKLARQWGPVTLATEFVASSHRFDDVDNARRLGGYGIVNVTAEWALARDWSLLVRGDNVFDRQYELAANYSTGGATVFAGLRWLPR